MMLKIRLQGTKCDIKWFLKILTRIEKIKILSISDFYKNKGTDKYCRMYMDIEKSEKCNKKS